MPSTYESDLAQANLTYIQNWDEIKRFVTYELIHETGVARDTLSKVHQKITEIQQRTQEKTKRLVYQLFVINGTTPSIYLVDGQKRTELIAIGELSLVTSRFDEAIEELKRLSPFEWKELIHKMDLGFEVRPHLYGTDYGYVTALAVSNG